MTRPVSVVEPGTVKLERVLPGPVERVWAYITEPAKRAKWLCAGEFEARVGAKVVFQFDHSQLSGDQEVPPKYKDVGKKPSYGVITRVEPLRLLAHTWIWDSGETTVTYELTPRGKDVLLTIVHSHVKGREATASVMGGWDVHTGILADVLNGAQPRPFWKTHSRLEAEYGATL